jgi:molybdopterin converting factor subunit 1
MNEIKVKLFAAFREIVGQNELSWTWEAGQTAAGVQERLVAEYPKLASGMKSALVMVNRRYANRDTPLQAGDEIAFLPPVGGGQAL